ncbi:MAG TPA: glycosyltransferase, partial [Planctomycetes bacterium]|nr:glycosyltransferase [Planctomycetota bacterium]
AVGRPQTFDTEPLYKKINGQAEQYLKFGFTSLTVLELEHPNDGRSLDVFLGTSSGEEEGFFLPAIEAMACGVPSVLTDIPCFRNHQDLVGHDRYALFVDPQDPTAMAEAIVLAGALPDIRTSLRAGGIEVAVAV